MTTVETARLYARIALLRRKALLRHALRRAAAGILALAALVVAAGFGTKVAWLALLPRLGELGATAVIGGGYLLVAVILAIIALREPRSAELAALEQMEAEAGVKAEIAFKRIGLQAETLTGNVLTGISLVRLLRRLLGRKG